MTPRPGAARLAGAVLLVTALLGGALLGGVPAAAQSPSSSPSSSPSGPPPPTPVTVVGTIQRHDGTPAARVPVLLTRRSSGADAFFDVFTFTFTFGLIGFDCVFSDDAALESCRRNGTFATRTDRAGRFRYDLTADEARTRAGSTKFLLTASLARSASDATAPTVVAPLNLDQREVVLPPLRFWETRPTLVATGTEATVRAGAPGSPAYSEKPLRFETAVTTGADIRLHTATENAPEATFDLRLLEDHRVQTALTASGTLYFEGGKTNVSYRTPVSAYAAGLRPVSRGLPCVLETTAGRPELASRCWATDGALGKGGPDRPVFDCRPGFIPEFHDACLQHRVTSITLDLRRSVDVGLVVVRGCSECTVSTSTDNRTFSELGPVGSGGTVEPGGSVAARFVRLQLSDPGSGPSQVEREVPAGRGPLSGPPHADGGGGGDLTSVGELSVWTGEVPAAIPVTSGSGSAPPIPQQAAPGADDASGGGKSRLPLALLAGLLALGVVGTLAYTLGRRRGPRPVAAGAAPGAVAYGDDDIWRPPA